MVGRAKLACFDGIKDHIEQRVQGWKERFLSWAGKELLLKVVAQVIPTFTMSCFLLPKKWCEEANLIMAKFRWGQTKLEKKIDWLKWDKLFKAKEVGGIGFKDLHSFNVALLAKQGWRLSHISNSLSYCMMKANFFPSCHFLHAKLRSNPSFLWRNILGARDIVREDPLGPLAMVSL